MVSKRDLEKMSLEELDQELIRLSGEKERVREEAARVTAVYDQKAAQADAERVAATLSDDAKAALAQVIKSEGIKPTSAVGTPGAKG